MPCIRVTDVFVGKRVLMGREAIHHHLRHSRRWPFRILFPGEEEHRAIDALHRDRRVLNCRKIAQ